MSHMGVFYDKEVKQIKEITKEELQPVVESILQLYTGYEDILDQLENIYEDLENLREALKNDHRSKDPSDHTIHNSTNTNKDN